MGVSVRLSRNTRVWVPFWLAVPGFAVVVGCVGGGWCGVAAGVVAGGVACPAHPQPPERTGEDMSRRRRSAPGRCPADLGNVYVVDGQSGFPCERPPHDDEWHQRWSPPVAAKWRDLPNGGRHVESGRTVR